MISPRPLISFKIFTILELVWIVRYMFGVYRIYHLLQNWKKLMIKRSVPWQPIIISYLPEVLILSKSGNLTLIKVSLFRAHFGSYQIKCGASSRGSSSLYFSCGIRTKRPIRTKLLILYFTTRDRPLSKPHSLWSAGVGGP